MKLSRIVVVITVPLFLAGAPATAPAQVSKGTPEAKAELDRGKEAIKRKQFDAAVTAFRRAIELDPTFVDAHWQFVSATRQQAGPDKLKDATETLRTTYAEWAAAQPKNAVLPYFLGTFEDDLVKADEWFTKAIALDPKFEQPYQRLAGNATMRGENTKAAAYRQALIDAVPDEPQHVLSYAYAIADTKPRQARDLALAALARAPKTDTGARALSFLASRASTPAEAIAYFERMRREFAPWFPPSASELFDLYAKIDPAKAAALARQMADDKVPFYFSWSELATMQEHVVRARSLITAKQAREALSLLDTTTVPKYVTTRYLDLLRAEAESAAGQPDKAYDRLADMAAKEPREDVLKALHAQAARVKKTPGDVQSDLWLRHEKMAKTPKPFELERYRDRAKVRLADYRGRVVFLNFFFPG